MLIPNTIPAWYTITTKAREHGVEIKINVDPFAGKQTGHIFMKDATYSFSLEMYPKNMILSIKPLNFDLFKIFNQLFDEKYRILYEASTEIPFHAEWYFDCEEPLIQEQLELLSRSTNIKVLDKN